MKTYMIVTNDKYELPVSDEIVGAKAVSKELCIELQSLRNYLHSGFPKRLKNKVIILKNQQYSDKHQYNKDYAKRYSMTHDRSEYYKEYQRKKKERLQKNGK